MVPDTSARMYDPPLVLRTTTMGPRYLGLVFRTTSATGSTPMDTSSGDGRGAVENPVTLEGQTLLMRMSTSWVDVEEDMMDASDL